MLFSTIIAGPSHQPPATRLALSHPRLALAGFRRITALVTVPGNDDAERSRAFDPRRASRTAVQRRASRQVGARFRLASRDTRRRRSALFREAVARTDRELVVVRSVHRSVLGFQ